MMQVLVIYRSYSVVIETTNFTFNLVLKYIFFKIILSEPWRIKIFEKRHIFLRTTNSSINNNFQGDSSTSFFTNLVFTIEWLKWARANMFVESCSWQVVAAELTSCYALCTCVLEVVFHQNSGNLSTTLVCARDCVMLARV